MTLSSSGVQSSTFIMVKGLGFRVEGYDLVEQRCPVLNVHHGSGFRVQGSGFRVEGFYLVEQRCPVLPSRLGLPSHQLPAL